MNGYRLRAIATNGDELARAEFPMQESADGLEMTNPETVQIEFHSSGIFDHWQLEAPDGSVVAVRDQQWRPIKRYPRTSPR